MENGQTKVSPHGYPEASRRLAKGIGTAVLVYGDFETLGSKISWLNPL